MKHKTARRMTRVIDNYGNVFRSYREAGRFWGLAPNTIKRDCLGITKYSDFQKGSKYERKIRFRRYEKWILSNTE